MLNQQKKKDFRNTLSLIVFGDSSRDDFEKVQPLLRYLLELPLKVHFVFVPLGNRMVKELNSEFWLRWSQEAHWNAILFLPLVRVVDLPWLGSGSLENLPVLFLRNAPNDPLEVLQSEVAEFIAPLFDGNEEAASQESWLRCDLLRTMPQGDVKDATWLSVRGGLDLLPKIPFLIDYLSQPPFPWGEAAGHRSIPQLRNELFQKDVTIKRLLRNEKRYRKFFEDDITGDFLMDLNWRILDCNKTFVRIFGFPSVDYALGFDIRQLFPNRQEMLKVFRQFRQLNTLDYYELELIRPDGQVVHIIANLLGIRGDDGRLFQVRGFLFDNTPRKNLEKQLRESQKMEGLGRLAGGIAHDFNNLLTVINGYTELLLSDLPAESPLALELGEIFQAGLKASDLTRQLLAFSRRQVLSPQVLSLDEILTHMETMLMRLMPERIELHLEKCAGSSRLKADKSQLEQVILNLVLNARDAMPEGGVLTVRTKQVLIETSTYDSGDFILPDSYVQLQVVDTGVGMEEEVQKRIFEPFFTTKSQGKGTGLGLAMVYGIVQQSGGYLTVQSEPEKGSVFTLLFALHTGQDDRETLNEPTITLPAGRQERLVLVEDEDMVREYTTRVLSRYGYQVKGFRNGADALNYLLQFSANCDLVLSDIVMPLITGPELEQKLRLEGIDRPFLYMSGYTDDEIIRHGVSSNQVMFIHKPFKSKELLAKVREVLDAKKE